MLVRPRTTIERVPSLTALLSRRVSPSMIVVPPLLTCAAGTDGHAWQSSRASCWRVALAARVLNSLHGRRGGGVFMRLRAQLGPHQRRREAVVGRVLVC